MPKRNEKRYKLYILDVAASDLSSLIDLVHDCGGEVTGLEAMPNGNDEPPAPQRAPAKHRPRNVRIGPGKVDDDEDLRGLPLLVYQCAVKYKSTTGKKHYPRGAFTKYCQSQISKDEFNPKSISPCISNLLDRGVLVEES